MSFLSAWTIALAAGLTVPPLVLLYFLKLKRVKRPISSTLLWKRAVQDLEVNSPFQRIRNNLLLWLQLLVLALAALALGKPIMQAQKTEEDTVILLVDQSASMAVREADGQTRLDLAKRQARTLIDNLPTGSRAMVIGFGDRATIVSTFDTDKKALQAKIDTVEQTDAVTTLSEALTLAEAYLQNLVVAGSEKGTDVEIRSTAGPARVAILTDGNVEDARRLNVQHLPTDNMQVVSIGQRSDNVGILSLDAKRNFERPAILQVFAMVRNFGEAPVTFDAHLYLNGQLVDVQTLALQPGRTPASPGADQPPDAAPPPEPTTSAPDDEADTNGAPAAPRSAAVAGAPLPGSVASVAFDDITYEGGGAVEVLLQIDDALATDNRAWTLIRPPRNVGVLLVSNGDIFLQRLLPTMPLTLTTLTPEQYEAAAEDELIVAGRSKYDVVIIENHSTERLPPGNYIFFGGVPKIAGVSAGDWVENEVIFNWDESHPLLRYVAMEAVQVYRWLKLALPPHATTVVEGESGPILALLSDQGRQFLICAFGIITADEATGQPMLNTDWVTKAHFPVFVFNALQHLSGSLVPTGTRNIRPGEPIEFPAPSGADSVRIRRPDGEYDRIPTGGFTTVHYAKTRQVGLYRVEPGPDDQNTQAVNLFDAVESNVAPARTLTLAGDKLASAEGVRRVNQPVWPWLLLAMLGVLALEWAVYSKRVYV